MAQSLNTPLQLIAVYKLSATDSLSSWFLLQGDELSRLIIGGSLVIALFLWPLLACCFDVTSFTFSALCTPLPTTLMDFALSASFRARTSTDVSVVDSLQIIQDVISQQGNHIN